MFFRHEYQDTQEACAQLMRDYPPDFMGCIIMGIFDLHYQSNIVYELDDEAKGLFEEIFNKYNGQYNLKYSGILGHYCLGGYFIHR